MVRTDTTFTTSSKALQAIYDGACRVMRASVKPFGDRRILTSGADSDTTTLHTELVGATTLSCYDLEAALDTARAFLITAEETGQPAATIACRDGAILPRFGALTGLCFAEEALDLYYVTRRKDGAFLELLLDCLLKFDAFLWMRHDLNFNHILEVFSEQETEEGVSSTRFAPRTIEHHGETRTVSPFPVESADLMALDVSVCRTLAHIFTLKGNAEESAEWEQKARDVQDRLKANLWVESASACYDRDYLGHAIEALTLNNLTMMRYGAFDSGMADAFLTRYMAARDGFGTSMPLPTVARGNRYFENQQGSNFNGQPRGASYGRAIGALERYGHFALLTDLGDKLLSNLEINGVFAEQFDPFTGEPSGAADHMPTASATLEFIARFFGVRPQLDRMLWGALGHGDGYTSEYTFTWGTDVFLVACESTTTTGYLNGERLFTVSNGVRVVTDVYGDAPVVTNVTAEPLDCVFAYRKRTFSFTLAPGASWQLTAAAAMV